MVEFSASYIHTSVYQSEMEIIYSLIRQSIQSLVSFIAYSVQNIYKLVTNMHHKYLRKRVQNN